MDYLALHLITLRCLSLSPVPCSPLLAPLSITGQLHVIALWLLFLAGLIDKSCCCPFAGSLPAPCSINRGYHYRVGSRSYRCTTECLAFPRVNVCYLQVSEERPRFNLVTWTNKAFASIHWFSILWPLCGDVQAITGDIER